MTTLQIFVLIFVFLSAAGATLALVSYLVPRPIAVRLKQAVSDHDAADAELQDGWQGRMLDAISPAAKLTLPKEGWENSPFRQKFMHAGFRGERAPLAFFALKAALLVTLPFL